MSLPPPPPGTTTRWTDLVPKIGRPRRPGLVTAAAIFLILGGVISIWVGFGALGFGDRAQLTAESQHVLSVIAAVLLLVGGLQVGTGILILGQRRLGRTLGIVLAAIGMVSSILRFGVSPIAGLVSMALNGLVLYALTAYKGAFGRWD